MSSSPGYGATNAAGASAASPSATSTPAATPNVVSPTGSPPPTASTPPAHTQPHTPIQSHTPPSSLPQTNTQTNAQNGEPSYPTTEQKLAQRSSSDSLRSAASIQSKQSSTKSAKSTNANNGAILPIVNSPHTHSETNGVSPAGQHANSTTGSSVSKKKEDIAQWLAKSVDSKQCSLISVANCFLTGFTSAIAFSACYIWVGFQTGNVAQLAIALSRNFDPIPSRTHGFQKGDQQALTSLVCFWIGASLGRIGARMGPKSRRWLLLATAMQVVLTIIAAILAIPEPDYGSRPNPSWADARGMCALGCLSAGLGIQGIIGKRIGSEMNTTVVLTATWVEIFNEPGLFNLGFVRSRDARIAGVLMIFVGAFVGRSFLGVAGSGGALGVLAGLRALSAVGWMMIPAA